MSKTNKKEVGKGIRALLANIDSLEKGKNTKTVAPKKITIRDNEIDLKYLVPNPFQPRKEFDRQELNELVQSIKIHGIIQPIAVRRLNSKNYQIISGERRWRAAKELRLEKVPVHILEADDQSMLEIALLENVQRADLNPMEIAVGYERLIQESTLTHEELSERVGKKRSSISNYIRLLKLSPSVQEAIKENKITLGHAKVLAGIERREMQTLLLGRILENDLSVRSTEAIARSTISSKKTNFKIEPKNQMVEKINRELSEKFGKKINITRSQKGSGFIKIPFSSDDEFNDIIDSLLEK